jgi:uncharacterized membrane protein YgcG
MTDRWWRRTVFLYEIGVLCGLLALAFAYYKVDAVTNLVPGVFKGLPVEVAWFGALGGVAISLKGVYDHPVVDPVPKGVTPWENRWVLWHLGRPFSGLLAGVVTYALLKAVFPSGHPAASVVLAAAFILGTQENRFFEFLNQVGAVIVAVPDKGGGGNGANGGNGNGGNGGNAGNGGGGGNGGDVADAGDAPAGGVN